jgi:hypothetical protein
MLPSLVLEIADLPLRTPAQPQCLHHHRSLFLHDPASLQPLMMMSRHKSPTTQTSTNSCFFFFFYSSSSASSKLLTAPPFSNSQDIFNRLLPCCGSDFHPLLITIFFFPSNL